MPQGMRSTINAKMQTEKMKPPSANVSFISETMEDSNWEYENRRRCVVNDVRKARTSIRPWRRVVPI
jgi:hypothetical protein